MAYSVNFLTGLITIPLSDLVWSVGNTYELALSDFHGELRRIEAEPTEGLWALQILDHTSPKTISGVTYAPFDELDPFYSIQFAGSPDAVILKGSNNNILDVYDFNGVSVAPNNSAGLQDLSTLLSAAYNGEVAISTTRGQAGTSIPIGTRHRPSSNWSDTHTIADKNGINIIRVLESMDIDSTADFSDGHNFLGANPIAVVINILPEASVSNCLFGNAQITGTLDNYNTVRDAGVYDLLAINGILHQVTIIGKISVASGGLLTLLDSHSGVAGGGLGQTAEIDLGLNGSLRNSNYTGGINLTNFTGGGDVSMDVNGRVIVESTCTGGDIYIRGNAWVTDESGPGCTVHDQTINAVLNKILNSVGHMDQAIFIDIEKVDVGDGSINYPFNGISNAVDYAESKNIKKLITYTDMTIDRQLKNFVIIGVGTPVIDCNDHNLDGSEIFRCVVTGAFTGSVITQECNLLGGTFSGYAENCGIQKNFAIPDGGTGRLKNCSTMEEGLIEPDISFGIGSNLIISGHAGGLSLSDMTDTEVIAKILISVGKVTIKSTCTSANKIIIGGISEFINESNLPVVDKTINPNEFQDIWDAHYNKRDRDVNTNIVDLYSRDKLSVKQQWQSNSDYSLMDPIV